MKKQINILNLNIPVVIQSYRKSKSIKLFYKKGYIKVTKPIWYSSKNIEKYIKDNIEKIKREYTKAQQSYIKEENNIEQILYLGKIYNIKKIFNKEKNTICFKDNSIYIEIEKDDISNEQLKDILKNYLKQLAKTYIYERLIYNSNITNIKYNAFRIKDCKTMWGSCSNKQNLNFNYKIIMFPISIIDQIIIHELCHIKYLNHSEKFWNLVYSYCNKEEYVKGEKWIRQNKNLINVI